MKCYEHREVDAVAVCKHCAKGLCAECATFTEAGASCAGVCAGHVAALHAMAQKAHPQLGGMRTSMRFLTVFLALVGAIFMLWGYASEGYFMLTVGAFFIASGVATFFLSSRYPAS